MGLPSKDGLRAMKVEEKKEARGEPPSYLKWMCITSSITGDFPLTEMLHGHPKFRWFAFPTFMFFFRLFLGGILGFYWVVTVGEPAVQINRVPEKGLGNYSDSNHPQEMMTTLMVHRSKTALIVLFIVMGSFSALAYGTIIVNFLKGESIQVVFVESRQILVDTGLDLNSKKIFLAYFLPWFASVFSTVTINVLFMLAGYSSFFVTISVIAGVYQIHSIVFPPFLCLYFCSVVAEAYRSLTAAISDPRVTQKDVDVNLWDKRLKEFVRLLSSALGIQALFALVATIISTTASLFMVLIEMDFKQSGLEIALSLSLFFIATLASWNSTAVFLLAAHQIRKEEAFSMKKILQSDGAILTGSGFVRLGYPVYYDIIRHVIMFTIIFLQFRSSEH
ncbi:unnamed protein product [Darwinula stevensoni]|uniref:Uncharacterized protein n=1 Tax=Darwinula stevensoni TaxID=69355 RepID=A0A7R9ADL6_9CRUS|nr:unnamed protein product [Darwinula stevensoni]CAG0901445.1 unnamed protein product [Darwinula stevensoni]